MVPNTVRTLTLPLEIVAKIWSKGIYVKKSGDDKGKGWDTILLLESKREVVKYNWTKNPEQFPLLGHGFQRPSLLAKYPSKLMHIWAYPKYLGQMA